jgi:hypothetical protein
MALQYITMKSKCKMDQSKVWKLLQASLFLLRSREQAASHQDLQPITFSSCIDENVHCELAPYLKASLGALM